MALTKRVHPSPGPCLDTASRDPYATTKIGTTKRAWATCPWTRNAPLKSNDREYRRPAQRERDRGGQEAYERKDDLVGRPDFEFRALRQSDERDSYRKGNQKEGGSMAGTMLARMASADERNATCSSRPANNWAFPGA